MLLRVVPGLGDWRLPMLAGVVHPLQPVVRKVLAGGWREGGGGEVR